MITHEGTPHHRPTRYTCLKRVCVRVRMVVYLVVGRNIFFSPFVPERMYRGDCFSLSSITIDSGIGYQRAVQPVDRWRRLILRQRDDWADFKASNMAPRRQVLHAPGNQLISVALELIHPVQKSKKAQKLVRNMMDRDPRLVHCMLSVSLIWLVLCLLSTQKQSVNHNQFVVHVDWG